MYQIVSDGSFDLDQSLMNQFHIHVVPFYITTDNEHYQKEKEDLEVHEFYQFMVDHKDVFPKTSMPSIEDYIKTFTPILENQEDIICICITTKFSGSYNSAMNAKMMLEEKYPERQITIIDATVNTVLQGLLVIEAAQMKEAGYQYDEVIQKIENIKSSGRIFFTVGNFEYLIHGGRIGKVAGVAAKTLGIRPLIVLHDGEIFAMGVTRGREKSKKKVLDHTVKYFKDNQLSPNDYRFCVGYGYDQQEGEKFKESLQEVMLQAYPDFHEPILIQQIGATIGVHTGPYPIGVGILKKYDL